MTPGGLDAELVEAARQGSTAAFGRLVDRHQRAVRAFLRRLCGNAAEADDLAQETFLAAWTQVARFRGEAEVRAWMLGIAWRRHLRAARSGVRRRARDAGWSETETLERAGTASPDDRLTLERALAGLPLEQRASVALCLGGDFSHAEAAEILGLPLGTVKSHVARGRTRLMRSEVAMSEDQRMEAEARLARFFAEDGLADHDPVFSASVGEAIARRRLRRDLAWLLLLAGLGTLVLWSLAPALTAAVGPLARSLTPALTAGVLLASLHIAVSPVLRRT